MSEGQNFIPQTPDLNLWLRFAMANFAASINCISLGTVDYFDPDKQTVNIAINYLRIIKGGNPNLPNPATNDQTSDIYLPYPILIRCPLIINQGGGATITMPIKKGDTGIVLFNDREIDTWITTGQTTYPHNLRTHDLSDGIFLSGINNLNNPIVSYDNVNLKISFGGGFITISPTGIITIEKGSSSISIDTSNNINISATNVTITGSTQVSINP